MIRKSEEDRFSEKYIVNTESQCWEWQGCINKKGYGTFWRKGSKVAHRVSYILYKGGIPDGMHVCHSCDNRKCVNPDHLWLGTNYDNVKDRHEKGRSSSCRGENCHLSKLNWEDVNRIRGLYEEGFNLASLGKMFNVSYQNIGHIVRRETWNHVS